MSAPKTLHTVFPQVVLFNFLAYLLANLSASFANVQPL